MQAKKYVRDLEELVDLQDKAIIALQQATQALALALAALQQSMAEKGRQEKFTFTPQYTFPPNSAPLQLPNAYPYMPTINPLPGEITWGDPVKGTPTWSMQPTGISTGQNSLGQANNVLGDFADYKQGYDAWVQNKEHQAKQQQSQQQLSQTFNKDFAFMNSGA